MALEQELTYPRTSTESFENDRVTLNTELVCSTSDFAQPVADSSSRQENWKTR